MSRTRLFSQIHCAIKQASISQRAGWSKSQFEDIYHSRRDFLKASALLALPIAIGASMPRPSFAKSNSTDLVLILGGGAAGLAAGYTLKKAGVPFRILEASSRVGGRILTQSNFNSDHHFIELGAEYVDSNHQAMLQLAKEVGVEIQDVSFDDHGFQSEVFYFGGMARYHQDLVASAAPFVTAIHAAKAEIGPQFSYRNATVQGVKWDHVTLAEFLQGLRGRVEDWFLDAVSVGYTLEMGREPEEQSVLNLFWQVDDALEENGDFELYGPSDETRRVKGGNSKLPERLAEIIRQDSDALTLSTRVLSLCRQGSDIVVTAEQERKIFEYKANRVICTLPLTALRQVEGLDRLGFSPAKLDCIRNMRYGQNSKIIMDFSSRLWRQKNNGLKPSTGSFMGDFASQSFWETSKGQGGQHGVLTNFLGGRAGENASSAQITTMTLPDLAKMLPALPSQYQNVSALMNWNRVPWVQGSYICVSPGQYSRFFGAQSEPELNGQILFAGEHTSVEFMGYMNGAYETGIRAAQALTGSQTASMPLIK